MKTIIITLIALFSSFLFFSCGNEKKETPAPTVQKTVTVNFINMPTVIHNNDRTFFEVETTEDLTKVEFFFDNRSIGSVANKPYRISFTPMEFVTNDYEVTAIATFEGRDYKFISNIKLELKVGEHLQGGIVFSLSDDKKNGLIASESDLKSGIVTDIFNWGPSRYLNATSATDGLANTRTVINGLDTSQHFHVWEFIKNKTPYNGFSDWYVPSYEELKLLRDNKNIVGGFSSGSPWYWSSTEIDANRAYVVNFNDPKDWQMYDKRSNYRVRLIRKL